MKKLLLGLLFPYLLVAAEAPQAPSDLLLTATSETTVDIKWTDNSDDETGFKIYRDGELIHKAVKDTTHYIDTGLQPNTTYKYIIRATNDPLFVRKTLQVGIAQKADDAEEYASGTVDLWSSDLEMVEDSSTQVIGIRFKQLDIPADAVITQAYIQFQSKETSDDATHLTIQAQKSANAPAFTESLHNISTRAKTTASVTWSPEEWETLQERGIKERTTDVSSLLQEVIHTNGWKAKNAIAFIITGDGKRVAVSSDNDFKNAPKLYVAYRVPFQEVESHTIDSTVKWYGDDASESNNADVELYEKKIPLAKSDSHMLALSYRDLGLPKGVTITKAYIQFQAAEVSSTATTINIHMEKSPDISSFQSNPNDLSTRIKTQHNVSWHVDAWNTLEEKGIKQRTPNLASLIQEIIDQDTWSEDNTVAFFFTGTGDRVVYSKDQKDANSIPALHIEYQVQPNPTNDGKGVIINEVLVANVNTNTDPDFNQYSSWIELYNESNSQIDIGGYFLSDKTKKIDKWEIPQGTKMEPKSYLLFWADKKDSRLHTNFKLKASGESVVFSDYDLNVIDSISYPKQKADISLRHQNDKIVYMHPTPKRTNTQTYAALTLSKKPSFSAPSGFYPIHKALTLTQENNAPIYYTTDGSTPTVKSTLYTTPIDLNQTTVVRTRALENGKFLSSVKTQTYLIDEQITLPVVSIAMDDSYLYGANGIYSNYRKDWTRAAHIEYIKDGEAKFSQKVGVRIFGNYTRTFAQKSLAIFAKSQYGNKNIDYPLFRDKPQIKKVKSFILRNSGNDWSYTMFNDALTHQIVKDMMDIDYQSYEPSIVFINGVYWGIYNIREKLNEDYLAANHGADDDKVDVLTERNKVKAGDASDYLSILSYIENHDLSDDAAYTYIASKIDIQEYMNYMITQLYSGNKDWPYTNIKYWREQKANSKWRWLLYDTDYGFALNDYSYDSMGLALEADSEGYKNPAWSVFLFNNLLKNDKFKNAFVGRFLSHIYLTFAPARVDSIIRRMKDALAPEISRHFSKWPRKGPDAWLDNEYGSVGKMHEFASRRAEKIKNQLIYRLNVSGDWDLIIDTAAHGKITLDGIPVTSHFYGDYYTDSTVTLEATPDAGYKFVKWSDGRTNPKITVSVDKHITLSPVFASAAAVTLAKVVITEVNYKSASDFDASDWIEIYNNDSADIDLSGWVFKDSKESPAFTIAQGTILRQGDYLVFAQEKAKFEALFAGEPAPIGDFSFSLGKKSDSVRLFDGQNHLIDSMSYDETWPDAKGNGMTLMLKDVNSDNALPASWEAQALHGTPYNP